MIAPLFFQLHFLYHFRPILTPLLTFLVQFLINFCFFDYLEAKDSIIENLVKRKFYPRLRSQTETGYV